MMYADLSDQTPNNAHDGEEKKHLQSYGLAAVGKHKFMLTHYSKSENSRPL